MNWTWVTTILSWPSTPSNNFLPLFLILWRTPFYCAIQPLRVALYTVAFLGFGKSVANCIWRDTA